MDQFSKTSLYISYILFIKFIYLLTNDCHSLISSPHVIDTWSEPLHISICCDMLLANCLEKCEIKIIKYDSKCVSFLLCPETESITIYVRPIKTIVVLILETYKHWKHLTYSASLQSAIVPFLIHLIGIASLKENTLTTDVCSLKKNMQHFKHCTTLYISRIDPLISSYAQPAPSSPKSKINKIKHKIGTWTRFLYINTSC